jgi:general stress protein 26
MTSINDQQAQKNRADLRGKDAVAKIRDIAEKAKNCFLCTQSKGGDSAGARPMNVRRVDDDGNIWFLSASDSHQNRELSTDPSVTLYFQGSSGSDFLMLHGRATVLADKKKVDELWEPVIKTWFPSGQDDPRITVIKVVISEGYYWDTKHGNAVAGVKMLIGAVMGKALDDSIEGSVQM